MKPFAAKKSPWARDTRGIRGARRVTTAVLALPLSVAVALPLASPAAAQENAPQPNPSIFGDIVDPDSVPERIPQSVDDQDLPGLPDGVSVEKVEWLTDRWANVYINSAAMPGEPVKVQILLARDWYNQPDKTFPSVWALDGMRARNDESGWTLSTNIAQYYADKNVNVVMPVGGAGSFYTDWDKEQNGVNYKWESFLINELPAVLREGWRTNEQRAITGLSMSGTAAVNLAAHNPGMFQFVGSFSGYLDTTSFGMPMAIDYAINDTSGLSATNMWGPYGSQRWNENDPKQQVDKLKDSTVYVSSGNGNAGAYDVQGQIPGFPANPAAWGLEALANLTSRNFVSAAKKSGVEVIEKFRPSGTHDWPYWQYEMTQAWPYMAKTFGLSEEDTGATCAPVGDIAKTADKYRTQLGTCITNEYDAKDGGKVQDFRNGRVWWKPSTGAHATWGRISARYSEMGGADSWLGYPTSEEITIANGRGRFVNFENGAIYWTPETGAVPVKKDIIDAWGRTKWETGPLGFPTEAAADIDGGQWQKFENGVIVRNKDGKVQYVQGVIANKYIEAGGPSKSGLGFPTSDEIGIRGGAFSTFDDGNIYWSAATGAHSLSRSEIFKAWGEEGYEQGKFGFPTSDETEENGVRKVTFQHGEIRMVNGNIEKDYKG